jgi:LysR family transcriptional regulator for metE and metH
VILEVKHLQLVEAVATYGTLTNASKYLNLSQSALSHQLNDLEHRLGTPLFHRVGRRLVATIAGDRLLDGAQRSLSVMRCTEESIRRIASGHEAVLRVTTECYTAYHWLPAILEAFAVRCPKVELQIVAGAARHPVKALLAGKVDIVLTYDTPANDGLEVIRLFDDDMLVVMSPEHALADRQCIAAEDFADEHLLMYNADPADSVVFRRVLNPAGIVPRKITGIQLTEAIVEMAKAGQGIAVLARWAVEPHLRGGSVIGVPLTSDGFRRTWNAVVIKQPSTPLYVREFCRLLTTGPGAMAARGRPRMVASAPQSKA